MAAVRKNYFPETAQASIGGANEARNGSFELREQSTRTKTVKRERIS